MFNRLNNYIFGPSVSLYPTIRMTGKTGAQVWRKYRQQRRLGVMYGVKINSPVPGEGIKKNNDVLKDRRGPGGTKIWSKDKSQIYKSNAICFEKENMRSQGSIFELVKARGSLFKITVFVHSKPGFIAREQADITARGLESAYKQLSEKFGSRYKRAKWRLNMLATKLPKWVWRQFLEFFL